MTSSLLATLREGPHLGVLSICSLPTLFIALLFSAVALYLYLYPFTERTLAFRNLRGPAPVSPVFGSLLAINAAPVYDRYNALFREHGASTLRLRSLFGKWRIVTVDPVAITYILRHTGVWHRNSGFNGLIERMCGQTVLCVEDESHRRQRRILQAAFTPSCVNDMTPIFWAEVQALKDNLDAAIAGGDGVPLDMLQQYTRAALNIIGRAGFNYDFERNRDKDGNNPLSSALNSLFNILVESKVLALTMQMLPVVLDLPSKTRSRISASRHTLDSVSAEIIAARKREIEEQHISLEKGEYQGRDIITLCLRANMAASARDKMSEAEVRGQIAALMIAGNETTATALSWASLHLTQHPDIQDRLRAELLAVDDDEPSVETLQALPYLDKFLREVLRFDPPVAQAVRYSTADCVVPLGVPVPGRDGTLLTEVQIPKGTEVVIPINNVQRLPEIWGDDADVFNPDRFDDPTIPRTPIPGVWGSLLTFLGGPHNCLGSRFAVLEMKSVLFMMLRNFVLEPHPDNLEITRATSAIMQRAIVVGQESKGMQMPVLVRPYKSK